MESATYHPFQCMVIAGVANFRSIDKCLKEQYMYCEMDFT